MTMRNSFVVFAILACASTGTRLSPHSRQSQARPMSKSGGEPPASFEPAALKSSLVEVGEKRPMKALALLLYAATSTSAFSVSGGATGSHIAGAHRAGFHSRPLVRAPVVTFGAPSDGDDPDDVSDRRVFDDEEAEKAVAAMGEGAKPVLTDMVDMVNDLVAGPDRHVAIVGSGVVGANTAFCMASGKIGQGKLTLTDIAEEMLEGQVMDMEDTGIRCTAASPQEAGQADVIVITAGRGLKDGETRLDCLKSNYGILKSVVDGLQPIKESAVIIVVSNPCDVLAYHVWKFSGLPANQVIGSGTTLDTARMRAAVSDITDLSPESIHYHMLGEHGNGMFPATSIATIAGVPLSKWPGMEDVDMEAMEEDVRIKGRLIREKKGATSFGVATACKVITEAILENKKQILSVSVKIPGEEAFLSLPCVVGSKGVEKVVDVTPLLNSEEQNKWKNSLKQISDMTKDVA